MIHRGATFEVRAIEHHGALAIEKRSIHAAGAALVREARILALASSAGGRVPVLLDVGRDQRGPYVVQSRVDGVPLSALRDAWGAIPAPLALHVAREIVAAYVELHARADAAGPLCITHGDPSFDNALFTAVGRVVLVDFGEGSARDVPETAPRQCGTPPYAAPELLRGEAAPSQATDRYAAAALVLALVSPTPLRSEALEAPRLARLASEGIDAAAIAAAPPALRASLAASLAFRPADRAMDLSSLQSALDGVRFHP